jgi:hypothetical protein
LTPTQASNEFSIRAQDRRAANQKLLRQKFWQKKLEFGGVQALFRLIDRDSDGRITRAEFKHGLGMLGMSVVLGDEKNTERLFKLIDVDGNGTLDVEELEKFIGASERSCTLDVRCMQQPKKLYSVCLSGFDENTPKTLRRTNWRDERALKVNMSIGQRSQALPFSVGNMPTLAVPARFRPRTNVYHAFAKSTQKRKPAQAWIIEDDRRDSLERGCRRLDPSEWARCEVRSEPYPSWSGR